MALSRTVGGEQEIAQLDASNGTVLSTRRLGVVAGSHCIAPTKGRMAYRAMLISESSSERF
jgi:hypothetical protein